MTDRDPDPGLVDAMWRAADLTRAYLAPDRAQVAHLTADLDASQLERVLAWLILAHDEFLDVLQTPPVVAVSEISAIAAVAPPEIEFAATTAVRRVAARQATLARAVEDLAPLDRVHAVAIGTTALLLTLGRDAALRMVDSETATYESRGLRRPYTLT